MVICRSFIAIGAALLSIGCTGMPDANRWQAAVERQAGQLGYRNWIRQVNSSVSIPETLDYVLNVLEQTENLRPKVYVPRELRSVENDFAPGIDELRKAIKSSTRGHELTELDQQSLLTLVEDANRSFDVLVIRTPTALPYSSIFIEIQPGYWDAVSRVFRVLTTLTCRISLV